MNKIELINQFNIRWSIEFDGKEKFKDLKNRINALLQSEFMDLMFLEEIEKEFDELIGISSIPNKMNLYGKLDFWGESKILRTLINSDKEISYFKNLQILFISDWIDGDIKENLKNKINNIIKISGYSNIVGIKKDDKYGYIVYPVGEKLLDENAINEVIECIDTSKTSYQLFINTLEKYINSNNDELTNVDIIDSLRRVLENYLKEKFLSEKQSIKDILSQDVGKYLKEKEIDSNIRSMYVNLGISIEKFCNENTKHRADVNIKKEEVELFIYLTGTLVRFLENVDKI